MSGNGPAIVWFRQDLRLADNPALAAAAATGAPILPVYILDDDNAGDWCMGAASRWWLHQSLASLNASLDGALHVLCGKADALLPELAASVDASGVFWNRCYEPWRIARDKHIKSVLATDDRPVRSSNGSLLFEPAAVTKDDGTPYKVFTPFYRNVCLKGTAGPRALVDTPTRYGLHRVDNDKGIDSLALLPPTRWYNTIADHWSPGEQGARARLDEFLGHGIADYLEGRNRPDRPFVSRLSPHLHFGEVSPHQAWHAARTLDGNDRLERNVDHFLSELGWREFSHYLLYYWPELPRSNLQKKFNRLPWRDNADELAAWQQGRTGYPMVDAGMRELRRTGYMHNRVRMLTGSFLVKNLLMHWHHGEDWFWDTLVDADLANNSASWQWVAGTGADAAPYFRIFNPVTQGKKFDPDGAYVREFVPELARLPDRFIHEPWTAPPEVLHESGVALSEDYPPPIVDLKETRERALQAFRTLTPAD